MAALSAEEALIPLIAGYLHGKKSDEDIYRDIGVPALFALSRRWSLDTITLDALQAQQIFSQEALQPWTERSQMLKMQSMIQQSQAQALVECFVQQGFHVLPLKGYYMKAVYPKPEHRQMCDLDFLLGAQEMEQVRDVMEQHGYATEHFGEGNHDSYRKKPFLYVELHRRLLAEDSPYAAGLGDMFQCATRGPEGAYHLSWTDFYLFMLVHFAKHMDWAGSGPRSVLDVYLFRRAYGSQLDEEYLCERLSAMGLERFRRDVEEIAQHWFAPRGEEMPLTDSAREMANAILGSAVYGTQREAEEHLLCEYRLDNGSVGQAGIRYLWSCLFPLRKQMEERYPVLRRWPMLLPACWLVRGGRMVFATPGRSWKNFQAIWHTVQRVKEKESGR